MQTSESIRDYPWSKEHSYGEWIVLCPASWHGRTNDDDAITCQQDDEEDAPEEKDNAEEKEDNAAGGRPTYDPRNRPAQDDDEEVRALKERIARSQEENGETTGDA